VGLDTADDKALATRSAIGATALAHVGAVVERRSTNAPIKIPVAHLLHLFAKSGAFPRLEDQRGLVAAGGSLWELVATWFVAATERVLRRDLVRDYEMTEDDLAAVRGTVQVLPTARHYYEGRLRFDCMFEEFGYDSALNRVIRGATRVVSASPQLSRTTRRRALALIARMEGVGEFNSSDRWPRLDRRTAHYRDALLLARHVLRTQGRDLHHGETDAWTFLIRTPEMVEAGLLTILQEAFEHIDKTAIQLEHTRMTLNPDLVIGNGVAIADVKYKLSRSDWDRHDLYQVVAFATGYKTSHAALVSFRQPESAALPSLRVGDVRVRHITWPADIAMSAFEARNAFLNEFGKWVEALPERESSAA
jgi:5-methylcytosine-specific restriction enzyme subunit McrC